MARTSLVQSRLEVDTAKAAHRRAKHALVIATQRVEAVTAQLTRSQDRIAQVQLAWKRQVIADYETGGTALQALATVLNGNSPADLMGRLAGLDALTAAHDLALSRTEASMALQQALERELTKARTEVRAQVAAAADELRRVRAAVAAAEAAREDVVALVARKRDAEKRAAAVRARDAAQLRELRAEQARIERMLRRRAAAAAARAATAPSSRSRAAPGNGFPWPVQGWISTPFGWRIHPIYGYRSFHNGIDIAAPCGTPVRAPAAGTVLQAYFQTAYGNRVLIDNGALGGVGTATEFNHLDRWAVSPGQRVVRGQVIGYVGSTGWSTGCHLHFTVYRAGTPVDPLPLLG